MSGQTGTDSWEMQKRHANNAPSNNKSFVHDFGQSSCTLKPCSSNVSYISVCLWWRVAVKLAIIVWCGEEGTKPYKWDCRILSSPVKLKELKVVKNKKKCDRA